MKYLTRPPVHLLFLILLLTGCDFFNLSVPDYLEEYGNGAGVGDWSFSVERKMGKSGRYLIPPGTETITVTLWNPQLYTIDAYVTDPQNTSASPTAVYYSPNIVEVTIQGADNTNGQLHQLVLSLSTLISPGSPPEFRYFDPPFSFPAILCDTPPEAPTNLTVDPGTHPAANWKMNVTGDHGDIETLTLYFKEGTARQSNRTFTRQGNDWIDADNNTINLSSDTYSIDFPWEWDDTLILDHYNFAVVLEDLEGQTARAETPGFQGAQAPDVSLSYTTSEGTATVTLSAGSNTPAGTQIKYIIDGDSSSETSYTGSFSMSNSCTITAWTEAPGCRPSGKKTWTIALSDRVYVKYNGGSAGNSGASEAFPLPTINAALAKMAELGYTSGTILLMDNITTEILLESSEMGQITNLTIDSSAGAATRRTMSGGASARAMNINIPGASVTIKNMNITGGNVGSNNGGAVILKGGTLGLVDCTISGGTAGYGNGVYVDPLASGFQIGGALKLDGGADIYLSSGKTMTILSALTAASPGISLTLPTASYAIGTQILSGNSSLISNNAEKIAINATDGNLWIIDPGTGKLALKPISVLVNTAYDILTFSGVPGSVTAGGGTISLSFSPNSPAPTGASWTIIVSGTSGTVSTSTAASFTVPGTAGQYTVNVLLSGSLNGESMTWSGSFPLAVESP